MHAKLQFLLLQVRDADDSILSQEVDCFARSLQVDREQVKRFDLLAGVPAKSQLVPYDALLIGGSGRYSATGEGEWLDRALNFFQRLPEWRVPTFASCWGFQAMSRALGGLCVHDPQRAELGAIELRKTADAHDDPLFHALPETFLGQAGHEDYVVELPPDAVLLASSERVENQAFKLAGLPIYGTQFHPELDRQSLLDRIAAYPEYVQRIAGMSLAAFSEHCREAPASNALLRRFAEGLISPSKDA